MELFHSFVLKLDGEAARQTLPEAQRRRRDERGHVVRTGGVLLVALFRHGIDCSALLVGPVVGEERFQRWVEATRTRILAAALEEAAEQVTQRTVLFRPDGDPAQQFAPARDVIDAQQMEVGIET